MASWEARTNHFIYIGASDFEYAGINPRGFDIANHFLEWTTDYHHPFLSHSVTKHSSFPSLIERQRFYRAYIPCDGGFDAPSSINDSEPAIPPLSSDDSRVQRLEEEVKVWTAASHAMYTVWSIVQATDDIVSKIDEWIKNPEKAREAEKQARIYGERKAIADAKRGHNAARPRLERGKSGEEIAVTPPAISGDGKEQQNGAERHDDNEAEDASKQASSAGEGDEGDEGYAPLLGDFDYCSYAIERVVCFREEMEKLGCGKH